ncbi:MAG: DEAD/DEAH box helicase [Lawsonibacter sp.]
MRSGTAEKEVSHDFRELGLYAPILTALGEQGYDAPSPIQEKAIPPALAGRDILGCAQTGTGKTCAFAAPILQRLSAQTVSGPPHPGFDAHPHPGAGHPDRRELRGLRPTPAPAPRRHLRRRGPEPPGGGAEAGAWTSSSPRRGG